MNQPTAPHLFGSYNARHLEPIEVAKTFVPSKKFWTLLEPNNSLLIGPRGSGKTTLLKMLQPVALINWQHEHAKSTLSQIELYGVFIPTDLNWKEEITVAVEALKLEERDTLIEALFVANIQLAFISTLQQLLEINELSASSGKLIGITRVQETEIVKQLIKVWLISSDGVPSPSFRALRRALRTRINSLSSFRPNFPDKDLAVSRVHEALRASQFDFENTVLQATGIVEDVTEVKRRWALSFDEVELAPDFIQTSLFKRLRSPSSSLVYKLAVAPFVPAADMLNEVSMPGVSNDWTPIPLWYVDQNEAQRFCEDLWHQIYRDIAPSIPSPSLLFGQSDISEQSDSSLTKPLPGFKNESKYAEGGVWQKAFEELYRKDSTFRTFIDRKEIDIKRLNSSVLKKRHSEIRKIAPLVYFRNRFVKSFDSTGRAKLNTTRVQEEIYSGWETICAVCEGNPRWFKGIVGVLLLEWTTQNRTIGKSIQAVELQKASNRFRALVSACPIGESSAGKDSPLGPLQLTDEIAKFQKDILLQKSFTADPALSVELDERASDELVQLVSVCLNIGALISIDPEVGATSLSSLKGRRFRLSYLLAPSYVLPLRTGPARSLSGIISHLKLSNSIGRTKDDSKSTPNQSTLWNEA